MKRIIILVSTSLVACNSFSDAELTGCADQEIINGTTVSEDDIGQPLLLRSDGWQCSATLLNDYYALTAHHCLTVQDDITGGDPVDASIVTLTLMTGQSAKGAAVYRHPTLDVAILQLATPLLGPNGKHYTNYLMDATSASLVGQTLYCAGWGNYANDDAGKEVGWGTLRSAYMHVSRTDAQGYDMYRNDQCQVQFNGDSGSSCFLNVNGNYYITGVDSQGFYDNKATDNASQLEYVYQVGADYFRDWVLSIVPLANVASAKGL
jgi:V8-like Glu-specific endopeptidase